MASLLSRCRIGCQIALLALVGIIGVLAVAGVDWWGMQRLADSQAATTDAEAARTLEMRAQTELLQARRHEKDFLLHHNKQDAALQHDALAAAQQDLANLDQAVAEQDDLDDLVRTMTVDVKTYGDQFAVVERLATQVGLDETKGMLGKLRDAVHAVEDALKDVRVPDAQIAMLMMRRHEKDFIVRLDPDYGAKLKAQQANFDAAVAAASLPDALKRELTARMAQYQDTFAQFMANTLAEMAAVKNLSTVYDGIEPRLTAAGQQFAAQADAAGRSGAAAQAATRRLAATGVAAVFLCVLGLAWMIGRGIARPIVAVTGAMAALQRGDLDAALPDDRRSDEIGTMIKVLASFRDSLIETKRLRAEQEGERERTAEQKRAALRDMAETIEREATSALTQIGHSTAAMMLTANEMSGLAARTRTSADAANSGAGEALAGAQTVASAAEQLTASIREISSQVQQSSSVVGKAVAAGGETRTTIEALNERVGRIGAVADMIGDIAAKTNLLALNATIEAARAGDAGKGFAVVASEVKQLATQTARSTEEITRHIAEVRSATGAAVTAVSAIEAMIGEISAIAGSIAAAVEQQSAATGEIARNVTETAAAVNAMSGRNTEVLEQAERTGRCAATLLENTTTLDAAVIELKHTVVRTVRTSTTEVDRRAFERHPADLTCQIEAGGAMQRVLLADISEGGAWLKGGCGLAVGSNGRLRLDGVAAALPFVVVSVREGELRVSFTLDAVAAAALRPALERMAARRTA